MKHAPSQAHEPIPQDSATLHRRLPKAVRIILLTISVVACAAAGIGGVLIGFRFFTNP